MSAGIRGNNAVLGNEFAVDDEVLECVSLSWKTGFHNWIGRLEEARRRAPNEFGRTLKASRDD